MVFAGFDNSRFLWNGLRRLQDARAFLYEACTVVKRNAKAWRPSAGEVGQGGLGMDARGDAESQGFERTGLIRAPQDFAGGLLLLAIAGLALWLGQNLSMGTLRSMGPGMLPKSVAVMLAFFGVVLIVGSFLGEGSRLERWSLRGPVFILGAIVLFGLTVRGFALPGGAKIPALGLAVSGPIVVFVGGLATPEARPRELALYALGMTAACAVLFKFLLGLPIPLAPWLLGY